MLDSKFFDRPAEKVAHDPIGCRLNWRSDDKTDSRIITETEAYIGPEDLASHAAKGRTKRNEAMFGPPGTFQPPISQKEQGASGLCEPRLLWP